MPTAVGVIDQWIAAPLGVLVNWLDGGGPYGPGDHTIYTWTKSGGAGVPVAVTYGAIVQINGAIPPKWGYELGCTFGGGTPATGEIWQPRVAQLVVQHQVDVLGGGPYVTTQIYNLHTTAGLCMWNVALPGRLGLYVAPDIAVDLQFLQTP